ncbi:DUF2057 family protein [Tatumella citrea]|uniref:DUF2057 domain-containing protein n=1 Tax=Tatumella citrea TaxID=53336 RepID=A0A1Y0L728_TATCI|nr:DUF2057 family protein [Tatumella citrea]ARU93555.1 hypothetical protein A7K98_07030 [Tatumella citrea]ARU97594.1 hypothetical protein A7K99_07030 [Tatumella citrea]
MKFLAPLLCLLLGSFSSAAEALSFRLNPEMNLLVLDGHPLPGSLLKGADSIELNRGQHQILFTIDQQKNSPAFIITFTAQGQKVNVLFPKPAAPGELQKQVSSATRFRVVDENDHDVPAIQDHLSLAPGVDYVAEMTAYNQLKRKASVEKFTGAGLQGNILTDTDNREYVNQDVSSLSSSLSFAGRSFQSLLSWLREFRTS